ncbi:ATP:corrinoid adenosyltransferase BtuR/CobO/CobP [Halorubrum aidingense JCM 13560]|uniref:ATP:corrinoid adenosyltransferase BtuR/CobO/CobP n=1 Tax=Halorubrum aidingense JCM 13560 TaxID=1230454 RepID=M0P576_9EURY|nr:cob(I)yrinic acid a,c-diamide adenosyltransferase [Halorubrum aidingense]EMA65307.1 ATP:corrinoid adenosyltransferase BtuR/CobO/CobP [Halorubrum aidingense JCM 13560]
MTHDNDTTDDTRDSTDSTTDGDTDESAADETRTPRTPGGGSAPEPQPIEPAAPEAFGLVQAWWGDGKGKTTAAMGMGFRAAGHGYRVHMLQFMKGGADSVEGVRGEYNAIAAMPGFTYENAGHYGWHGLLDGSENDEHEAKAAAAFERAEELVAGAADADLTEPLPLDGEADAGVHMLILDELLYAADRGLVAPEDVVALVESKPEALELVLTGSHAEPDYLDGVADLITNVRKVAHPFDAGHRARRGTEY